MTTSTNDVLAEQAQFADSAFEKSQRGRAFDFIDLFAGVGGFHHALGSADFDGNCQLGVEFDDECQAVYRAAFPGTRLIGNVKVLTTTGSHDATPEEIRARVPAHDVLCAGFPCQPFSKSGVQLGVLDRTRGTLFHDIMAIVQARKPRFVILENVPNLVGPRHRETWRTIIEHLWSDGYRVSSTPVLLSPHRLPRPIGSPQVRERVFILAHLSDTGIGGDEAPIIDRDTIIGWNPSAWNIMEVLESMPTASPYRLRPAEMTWLNAWDALVRAIPAERLPGFPLWSDEWTDTEADISALPHWKQSFIQKNRHFYKTYRTVVDAWREEHWPPTGTRVTDFPPSRRKFEWQASAAHPNRAGRTIHDLLVHFRPSGIRVKPPTYAPALVAINQTSIIASQHRRMSPREVATLQQLPFAPFVRAGTDDQRIYRQLGNAVHVGVVKFAAAMLFRRAGEHWGEAILDRVEYRPTTLELAA